MIFWAFCGAGIVMAEEYSKTLPFASLAGMAACRAAIDAWARSPLASNGLADGINSTLPTLAAVTSTRNALMYPVFFMICLSLYVVVVRCAEGKLRPYEAAGTPVDNS